MKRLGFDAHRIMRACIQSIGLLRREKKAPGLTLVEPVFESEVHAVQGVTV